MTVSDPLEPFRRDPVKLEALLEEIESSAARRRTNRRSGTRVRFASADVEVEIDLQNGVKARCLACSRDLGSRGISILLGRFVHAGSRVQIHLTRVDGGRQKLTATVRHCRYVRDRVHELGLEFDSPVDASTYVSDEEAIATLREESIESCAERVQLSLACLIQSCAMSKLVRGYLDQWMFAPEFSSDMEQLLERLTSEKADALLVDADDAGDSLVEVIDRARQAAEGAPILLMTSDSEASQGAVSGGDVETIIKPITRANLRLVLFGVAERSGLLDGVDEVVSELSGDETMKEIIAEYVQELAQMAAQLSTAMSEEDGQAAGAVCRSLRGSAASFGFNQISQAATNALARLAGSGSVSEASRELRHLAQLCTRARPVQEAA